MGEVKLDPNIHGRAPPPPKEHRAPGAAPDARAPGAPRQQQGQRGERHQSAQQHRGEDLARGAQHARSAGEGSDFAAPESERGRAARLADLKAREELAKRAVDEAMEAVEATQHPDMETLVLEAATDELSADADSGPNGVDAALDAASAALEMAKAGDTEHAREATKRAALGTLEAASHTLEGLAESEGKLEREASRAANEVVRTEGMPEGWKEHLDPASGRVYYERPDGTTQWERPQAMGSAGEGGEDELELETEMRRSRSLLQMGDPEDDGEDGDEDANEDKELSDEAKRVLSSDYRDYAFGYDYADGLGGAFGANDDDYYALRRSAMFDYYEHGASFPGGDHSSSWDQYVYVDAHVLCTPVVADIDGDGAEELIMSVSYFFDQDKYSSAAKKAELGEDVDPAYYVGGGIVVYSLDSNFMAQYPDSMPGYLKWSTHLDLTTDIVQYRAYIYSSPTVADVDGDGKMEVVVGTSVGFVYVLDAENGNAKPGWPVQMGEIQGQVAVGDVNGDGRCGRVIQRGGSLTRARSLMSQAPAARAVVPESDSRATRASTERMAPASTLLPRTREATSRLLTRMVASFGSATSVLLYPRERHLAMPTVTAWSRWWWAPPRATCTCSREQRACRSPTFHFAPSAR